MRSIAELLEITSEILLWKECRLWWINQCWMGGILLGLNLALCVIRLIDGEYLIAALAVVSSVVSALVLIRAIQGFKRADDMIEKLKESAVAP